jgi:hypothetical protein
MKHATSTLIEAVKDHANRCYTQGWDEVAECYDDYELLELIGNARTPDGAIRAVAKYFDLSPTPLTGWIVRTQDVDGRSVKSFKTLEAAAKYFTDMAGRPPRGDDDSAVSDFGNYVSINAA